MKVRQLIPSISAYMCIVCVGCASMDAVQMKEILNPFPTEYSTTQGQKQSVRSIASTTTLPAESNADLQVIRANLKSIEHRDLEIEKGDTFLAKGDIDTAIACYTAAIRLDPKSIDAFYKRGTSFSLKGNIDREMADYAYILQLDATNT
ncbi:MAG: tetratricopeptide repeat protein, partial [Pirellulaceae bacterium]